MQTTKVKCTLTKEQQVEVVRMGGMLLTAMADSSGEVCLEDGRILAPREYVNGVLSALGIDAQFAPPPPKRNPRDLLVMDAETKEIMAGRVSRHLEEITRRHPKEPVFAYHGDSGWWWPGGDLSVLVVTKAEVFGRKKRATTDAR